MTTPSAPPSDSSPDPDAVAAAVLVCPGVAAMSGGRLGEVATYLPGRRVAGVRLGDGTVEVHVVGRYGPPVETIAAEIRAALRPLVGGRSVSVTVEDLDTHALEGNTSGPGAVEAPATP